MLLSTYFFVVICHQSSITSIVKVTNNDIYFLSNDVQLEVAITLILLLNRDLIIVLNIIVTIRREKLIKNINI